MNRKIKVIVTSAGRSTGLNFCRSLRKSDIKYEIIGIEDNEYSYFQMETDKKYLFNKNKTEEEFIKSLKKIIEENRADFLYASKTDKYLLWISKNRTKLPIKVFLPSIEMVDFYEDKYKTYSFFKELGIKVPISKIINNEEELKKFIEEHGRIWLRCINGSGGKGSVPTDNFEFAKLWVDRFDGWGNFMGAEVLTDKTATWTGLWKNGELIVSQIRERLYWEFSYLNLSGVTGITGAQITKKNQEIDRISEEVIRKSYSKPHGIISVDYTFDKNNIPNPTEIQASRFFTSTYFMATLGLNFPDLLVKIALDIEIPKFHTKYSPLEENWIWIKFVDCLPKLIHKKELDKIVKESL